MSVNINQERSFEVITEICIEHYHAGKIIRPLDIMFNVMENINFPMHNFAHHFLVPASLMTSVCAANGVSEDKFKSYLSEIQKRAQNVLPAFCGFYGACGAAIGCGIFMSVYTETTPLSKETWALCNLATAGALKEMAKIGGPRCCKRNSFIAINFMKKFLLRSMELELEVPDYIVCDFSTFNKECLKADCPFYKGAK